MASLTTLTYLFSDFLRLDHGLRLDVINQGVLQVLPSEPDRRSTFAGQGPVTTALSGTRTYKCDYCDKHLRSKSTLELHIRSHTGEKPFKCEECGKSFNHNGNLKRHLYTHISW